MKRCLLFFLFSGSSLFSEIQQVTLSWDPLQCQGSCITLLEKNIKNFHPVVGYKIDPQHGSAILRWRPNEKFDLIPIKRVYQSVGFGFGIGNIQIKVHGVVEKKGKDFLFRSIGDGTLFQLLGQQNKSNTYSRSSGSYLSYPLSKEQENQLNEAYNENYVLDIQGVVFYMQFTNPMIIIQSIQFPNKIKK